uniref:Tumor necrosis factor n=1 Tax=Epinephelus awoara TaxID=152218 RepID=A9UK90_EPIAW|nr:tumor necrosis factor alpha [Epinephelus awoara]
MGLEKRSVVLKQSKSSTGWIWKVFGVHLMAAICVGGVLLFDWKWNGRPQSLTQAGHTEALIRNDAAENTDPLATLKRISSEANGSIHLQGSYHEGEVSKEQLEWNNGQGQPFAQGSYRLVNNLIVIPQTALYLVYTQASFRVSCSDGDEKGAGRRLMPLSHRIWRYSDSIGSRASLMSAVRSACQSTAQEDSDGDGKGWYNAIYLGAVFQLNRGDKLYTETKQLSEQETEEAKTFFGLFAL